MYDFETLVDRRPMDSNKWGNMKLADPDVPEGIVPFSIADMEFKNAPEVIDGLKEFLNTAILGYSAAGDGFKSAVQGWMRRRHSWAIEKDWICVSIGVVPAITNAVLAFTEPGNGVIVMTPVYFPFYESIERNHREIVKNHLLLRDMRYEIDFADLEQKAAQAKNKMLILCSPHNPVGRVWTREELEKIADICVRNDLILVSDEIHFDLIMPGHHHTVTATLSQEVADRCITCTSPSKTFNLAGMQTSAIIISNPDLRRKFVHQMECSGHFGLSILGYRACTLAYEKAEPWLDELLGVLDGNARFVAEYMAQNIPEIKVFPLEGTYLQWWDCRALGLDYKALSQLMVKQAHLFMDEGYMFGEDGQGFERLNLACPRFVLEEALERLRQAVCACKAQSNRA